MKVQVNVSEELVEQIDKYAVMMGISRSALCAMFIGQSILGYNKTYQMIDSLGERVGDNLLAERFMKEVANDEKQK